MSNTILSAVTRPIRRRLIRLVRKSPSDGSGRRAQAILLLYEGWSVTSVAACLRAARSSIYRWIDWFEAGKVDGLRGGERGRRAWTVTHGVCALLATLLERLPRNYGYLRSTWSSELLSIEVGRQLKIDIHPSTIRRVLPVIDYAWRRPRPALFKRDPRKQEKLRAIDEVVKKREKGVAVFFADEVDVHLLPKMGFVWTQRGRQRTVPTPGTNQKRYMAGALHAHTGTVTYAEASAKGSALFIDLLRALRRRYRGFRRIVLVVDNYIIHKSRETVRWLTRNPKFELLFQPVYCPTANRIERLWKAMHDTVTRNHRWATIDALMNVVRRFMKTAEPFPGGSHGLACMAEGESVADIGSAI